MTNQRLVRMWGNELSYIACWCIKGTVILEKGWQFLKKFKSSSTPWCTKSTPRGFPREKWKHLSNISTKHMYVNVHGGFIIKAPNWKNPNINRRRGKETLKHSYNGIWLSNNMENPQSIIPSERRQTRQSSHYTIPLRWSLIIGNTNTCDINRNRSCQWGLWNLIKSHMKTLWSDGDIPHLNGFCLYGCVYCQSSLNCILKICIFLWMWIKNTFVIH